MKQGNYTIADIAQMTQFSQRTIRNYIKDGRLTGQKVRGAWKFTQEDMNLFFSDPFIKQGLLIKNQAIVDVFMNDKNKKSTSLCTIYDFPISNGCEAEDICNMILNLMHQESSSKVNMSYNYDQKHQLIRVILVGEKNQIANMLVQLP